ncbi:MAG TPA: hypothetical protein PLN52_09830 [Opitutaceae bacterium]|nr:hypothetical protein [Opitutaceae bacterium]
MPELSFASLQQAFASQPLFEAKTWQLSPQAWKLSPEQATELEGIGAACLEFQQALETLYLRSANGKNLLRNKPLLAPWVAEYLDRGKPAALVAHSRDSKNRGVFPTVLRPDLLLTEEGFVMTELDSVPGGIGLTAFLNRLYAHGQHETAAPRDRSDGIIGGDDAMIRNFYASLAALRKDVRNPLIALVVSDEAGTYRPEMEWLAHQLQIQGKRVFCLSPDDIFPLGTTLCFDVEGNPEKIDVVYRFFELFDLDNVRTAKFLFEAWSAGEVAIAPPMRPFQEEKLSFALFHHHLLVDFWSETLSGRTLKVLKALIPMTWVIDTSPLPPGAVLDGPKVGGRSLTDWRQLAGASQKERDLIIKISGYHETAWGARSVVLGSDCSREEWQAGVDIAIADAPTNFHILQEYRKPKRVQHPLYSREDSRVAQDSSGRLRLCPYYFVLEGAAKLSGALATFCPPDKKIIHGMQDAALLPTGI